MSEDARWLDGNALGGLLHELFSADMTAAPHTCQSCGTERPVAAHRVYLGAGTVLRCPVCDQIALVAAALPRPPCSAPHRDVAHGDTALLARPDSALSGALASRQELALRPLGEGLHTSSLLHVVTQWTSTVTSFAGSAVNSSHVHERASFPAPWIENVHSSPLRARRRPGR